MIGLDLLIIGLAAWRLALLLVVEDGPFGIMARLRAVMLAGRRVDEYAVFQCVWCMAFWCSLVLVGVWQLAVEPVQFLAIWGIATALDMIARR